MNKHTNLQSHHIYAIPVGNYFQKESESCYLVYSPLANVFFLSLPSELESLEQTLVEGKSSNVLQRLVEKSEMPNHTVSLDSFCTLHLLLNEKCNFKCKYCYSAEGRSSAELSIDHISIMFDYFLSSKRLAVKDRTVMFMGGGEPMLSWNLLEKSTLIAEEIAGKNNVNVHFSLTTNGSILTEDMLVFLKDHDFTVQISFEILPDVQDKQRAMNNVVAHNLVKLTEKDISNYVRSTITSENVDRIPEMVKYCQTNFPKVTKLSCQQVVDPDYFTSKEVVRSFFSRYFSSFQEGVAQAAKTGLQLRSSSSHLINYSMRERFCYNIVCLTPYGTLTTCPDVSSPNESDYAKSIIAKIENGKLLFDQTAFDRLTCGNIHTIEKCTSCWAKWNCGSGCPSSRRVYSEEIFDSICDFYRQVLCHSLISELANKFNKATGKDFYTDIASKL